VERFEVKITVVAESFFNLAKKNSRLEMGFENSSRCSNLSVHEYRLMNYFVYSSIEKKNSAKCYKPVGF
jgi:hypothetical protein